MTQKRSIRIRYGSQWFVALLLLAVPPVLVGAAVLPGTTLAAGLGRLDGAPATSQPAGDVDRGRQLFMGEVHFENEGPPCMGCHNVGSNGLLGGGAMGPDLTDVSDRYGAADLAATLAVIPWPTMRPIYAEHPLTPQEQADLLAFLVASPGQPKADRELPLLGLSLAGLGAAAGFFGFLYRTRLRGVRKPLVKGARSDGRRK